MAHRNNARSQRNGKGIERVLTAITVASFLLVLCAVIGLLIVAQNIKEGAPRSLPEARLQAAQAQVDADPSDPEAYLALGAAQNRASMYSKALDTLDKIIDVEAVRTAAWYQSGIAYRGLGREDDAIDAFRQALTFAEADRDARLAQLEQSGVTMDAYLPDEGANACIALAELLTADGDYDGAREAVQRLLDDDETDASAWLTLAAVEEAAGDDASAATAYRSALRFLPDDPTIIEALRRLDSE